jgi:hypothetical protein
MKDGMKFTIVDLSKRSKLVQWNTMDLLSERGSWETLVRRCIHSDAIGSAVPTSSAATGARYSSLLSLPFCRRVSDPTPLYRWLLPVTIHPPHLPRYGCYQPGPSPPPPTSLPSAHTRSAIHLRLPPPLLRLNVPRLLATTVQQRQQRWQRQQQQLTKTIRR